MGLKKLMKKMTLVLALSVLLSLGIFAAEATFTAESYTVSDSESINYWLFTPAEAKADMPLIVYLHGGSGKGDDINKLTENGFCLWVSEGKFNDTAAYIIFPQLSSSYNGWAGNKTAIRDLITSVADKYSVNKEKISLVGHSMGGTGAYTLAAAYPEMFSCVMPMSGSVTNNEKNLAALSQMPLWAIVGENDTIVSPDSSIEFVEALQENGANAKITVLEGATHFTVPELAFLSEELDVVGWLTGQGDTEEDVVTVKDVIECIKHILDDVSDLKYDVNNDGKVSLLDAVSLLKKVVG